MAEGKGYESFYMGSYGPLDPEYGPLFTGYRVPASYISAPTSVKTANQIDEVVKMLRTGMKAVELQPFSSELGTPAIEVMPKQHWTEIKQLGKLAGATFSLHLSPSIDPAGFTEAGWSEESRARAELELKKNIERAHEIDIEGNIPIVIHATSGIPSTVSPKGIPDVVFIVDKDTGKFGGIRGEKKLTPVGVEKWCEPEELLQKHNRREWEAHMGSIAWETAIAGDRIITSLPIVAPFYEEWQKAEDKAEFERTLLPEQRAALSTFEMGKIICSDMLSAFEREYNRAMRLWPEEEFEKDPERKKIMERIRQDLVELEEKRLIESNPREAVEKLSAAIRRFHEIVKKVPPPIYVTTDDFTREKAKETIANAALHAYQKYGDKAPIIAVENVFAGTVHSRAEDLKKLIEESRKEFVKKAREVGISEPVAERAAEKLIGVTWDTGHIALLRRYGLGYSQKEFEKILAAETKTIAPFVKHSHITDNFGFEDSHLPPGMGEVPFKEMLKELEKAGFKGKKVIEAAALPIAFKTLPTGYVLEALGSPLYAMYMPPFWNQVRGIYGVPAGYSAGYGLMLPEQHFGLYGAGFATLPLELGGKLPGKGERFAGVPME